MVIWAKRVTNAIKTILHSSVRSSLPQAHPLDSLSTPCPTPPSKDFYSLSLSLTWSIFENDGRYGWYFYPPHSTAFFVLRFTMNILIILRSTKKKINSIPPKKKSHQKPVFLSISHHSLLEEVLPLELFCHTRLLKGNYFPSGMPAHGLPTSEPPRNWLPLSRRLGDVGRLINSRSFAKMSLLAEEHFNSISFCSLELSPPCTQRALMWRNCFVPAYRMSSQVTYSASLAARIKTYSCFLHCL